MLSLSTTTTLLRARLRACDLREYEERWVRTWSIESSALTLKLSWSAGLGVRRTWRVWRVIVVVDDVRCQAVVAHCSNEQLPQLVCPTKQVRWTDIWLELARAARIHLVRPCAAVVRTRQVERTNNWLGLGRAAWIYLVVKRWRAHDAVVQVMRTDVSLGLASAEKPNWTSKRLRTYFDR